MEPAHIGQGSMVEYTVAPATRSGVLAILAHAQHDAVAHEHGADGPIAAREGVFRVAEGEIHVVGVGHVGELSHGHTRRRG
jgi:hypothetical protein